MVDLFIRG